MAVRSGEQFLEGLRRSPPNLYVDGVRVLDPAAHPATGAAARAIAELYDLQLRPDLLEGMTFAGADGARFGMSFLEPSTVDDLRRRSRMHRTWARHSLGFIGRSPDYLNVNLMASARAASYFARGDERFGANIRRYFEHVRGNDLCLTHALTDPQVNRAVATDRLPDPYIALGVVRETAEGVVVRGARMLATLPIADELLIFPAPGGQMAVDPTRYALAFAVPCNTPGLTFIAREPLWPRRSRVDHPLGSRFDELDALVTFDDVLVPWERVFLLGDPELAAGVYAATNAAYQMGHQVLNVKIVKAQAFLGVAELIVRAIGSAQFQHVQQKMAELITVLETLESLLTRAEERATPDEHGTMTPDRATMNTARAYFPQVYPRMVEILQLLGASGMIMLPSEGERSGPMADAIDKYLQSSTLAAGERLRLFRLAWDMTISAFGGRQNLYEKFFFGDPVRNQAALYHAYDMSGPLALVEAFLGASDQTDA